MSLLTTLYASPNYPLWGTEGIACIFVGWHQKRCSGAMTSLSHSPQTLWNVDHVREEALPFKIWRKAASWMKSSERKNRVSLGGKGINYFFFLLKCETSGRAWHRGTNRWQDNMPVNNTSMPCCLLGNLALSDSALKSKNDTSERLI